MTGVETAADFGAPPSGPADRWKAEIRAFNKEREGWTRRVEDIERRYRDERNANDEDRRFALLWANIEVLQPTLYARDPKPEVSRRFKDRDPVGKVLGMVMERNLAVAIDYGAGTFGRTMKAAVKDFLLGGQGTAWVRYEVTMGTEPDGDDDGLAGDEGGDDGDIPAGAAAANGTVGDGAGVRTGDAGMGPAGAAGAGADSASVPAGAPIPVATAEQTCFDYVHWRDFGFTAGARTWDEVGAVWRRSFLTREACRKRFPAVGDSIPLDCKPKGSSSGDDEREPQTYAKATIYEVWDSTARKTSWVHLDMDALLDERDYPLKIRGKFPCPAPLFGTLTNGTMVPVPDYVQYQDQAREMDELTGRIAKLTSALRLVGFTPGDAAADLQKALDLPGEARMVAIPGWQAFGAGKLSDMIVWLPIETIVKTLNELQQLRERVKADAYEITGLSDILRGSTQASETATAQQLKAQWGSVRVRIRQQDVQRFAAEALNLMAEIMANHFDVERLLETANVQAMGQQDQQQLPGVIALLQGDKTLVHYRIDVETDSTVETDAAADKQAWSELLQGVASFLGAMLPVMQGVAQAAPQASPAMAAMVGEMLTSAVRRFKAGPAVEAAIEMAFEALGQAAAQPPAPPQPNPAEMAKAQAEQGKQEVAHAKLQGDQMRTQAEMQRTQVDAQIAQDDSQHRTADRAVEVARLQHEMRQPAAGGAFGAGR